MPGMMFVHRGVFDYGTQALPAGHAAAVAALVG